MDEEKYFCEDKSEKLRSSNSTLTKENQKLRERYSSLETLVQDIVAQNEQLERDAHKFGMREDELRKQIEEREEIINQKEQQIKDFRNKNIHLHNFRTVYDHRVTSLTEEHGPLVDHLENMEKHIKTIYKELLDEANSNKRLRDTIGEEDERIQELDHQIREKRQLVQIFRKVNETFEYVTHS